MGKKIINTIVKLGKNTLLDEAVKSLIKTLQHGRITDGGGQVTLNMIPSDSVLLNCRVVEPVGSLQPRQVGVHIWRFNEDSGATAGWWVIQLYDLNTGSPLRNKQVTVEFQYI